MCLNDQFQDGDDLFLQLGESHEYMDATQQGNTEQLSPVSSSTNLSPVIYNVPASNEDEESDLAQSLERTTSPKSFSANTGTIPKSRKTKHGRATHNIVEKKYRTNMNARIDELKNAVPTLRASVQDVSVTDAELDGLIPVLRVNKLNILEKATEYIKHLEAKNRALQSELNSIRAKLWQYNMAHHPVPPQNANQSRGLSGYFFDGSVPPDPLQPLNIHDAQMQKAQRISVVQHTQSVQHPQSVQSPRATQEMHGQMIDYSQPILSQYPPDYQHIQYTQPHAGFQGQQTQYPPRQQQQPQFVAPPTGNFPPEQGPLEPYTNVSYDPTDYPPLEYRPPHGSV